MGNKHTKVLTKNRFDYVVAMDIGTYGSGYAYQSSAEFETRHLQIHCRKWNSDGYKTPTCLLLKPDKTFVAFGSEARDRYYGAKNGKMKDYLYFENFKMMIYNRVCGDSVEDNTRLEAENGEHAPAIDVFTVIITHMKTDFINKLKRTGYMRTSEHENEEIPDYPNIKWVITVPVVWNEPAKRLMLKAAVKAGIPQEKLVLALEPECAAILCAKTPKEELNIFDQNGQVEQVIKPGAITMIVDIGGGTVDLSVMQINANGKMKHLYKSDGNGLGGARINNKILQLLREAFGESVVVPCYRRYPQCEKHLRIDVEKTKRMYRKTPEKKEQFVLELQDSLLRVWEEEHPGKCLRGTTLKKYGIERDGGHLRFEDEKVKEMFDECIDGIMTYLEQALEALSFRCLTLNAVVVVGGGAESNYITSSLREMLKEKKDIPVIIPEDPEMSVMKGAVLYGRDEEIISSRVMAKTYGVAMTTDFDERRNNKNEKFVDEDGKVWAFNVFRKHVEEGDEVPVHKWIQGKEYYPDNEEQTSQRVYIFQSDKKNPNHTTEEGCSCVGHIDVEFPAGATIKDRKVMVEFFFGGTMIQVRTRTNGKTKALIISGCED